MVGITPMPRDNVLAGALQRFGHEPQSAGRLRRLRPDPAASVGYRCADRFRRLRHPRARIQLGRLQGRRRQGQSSADDGQRAASDDPKFFKGKALTYYGRWTYKYEEAARRGAVGVLLIHQTDMASYPWEVVRNSNSGEKSYLKLDGTPKLKAAAWIQLDVARQAGEICRPQSRQDDVRRAVARLQARALCRQAARRTSSARSVPSNPTT